MLKNQFPALKTLFLIAEAVRGAHHLTSQFPLALDSLALEVRNGHGSALLDHFNKGIARIRTAYYDGMLFRRFRPSSDPWTRMTVSTFTNHGLSFVLRFESNSGARLDITHVNMWMWEVQSLHHLPQFAHITELVIHEAAVMKHPSPRVPDLPSVITLVIVVKPKAIRPGGTIRFFSSDRGDEPLVRCAGLLIVEIVCIARGPQLLDEHDVKHFLARDIDYDANKLTLLSFVGTDLASHSAYDWGEVAEEIRHRTSFIPDPNDVHN
ncbi:hypothetical protein AURDEDRAFT_176879 [Auricularia subglabra TFB-10046 SS5]|uniref:Uncharacterized protein n=1 Tax=Auricularia subglabra (strain TFB-10046 / SS5) TaxID=717982 RepID=J0CUQ3_AURST|nr:hypothetical protein AURDEDRAFT_176879 [Auricularia subglabra TFB-10046 SS5]